ncbi:hypothetical protein J2I47_21235 [Fibrella sp. HMF5335]|uniref:Uncharacterized protein n=1 Tax=Fibrella rubiginis TaxID=2817060 RepID=A0A939GMD9_9BACT|nr:hypothetical protein [Fibrella rubiginis]MBO0939092.1 hypothetical protein [Fibrella rubiginis]
MYENNPNSAEYPEVTPDPSTIEQPADQKRAVATATAGTVVLGAAAYGLSMLDEGDSEPVEDNSSAQAAAAAADARAQASALPLVTPVGDNNLNTSLDDLDSLTFDEAFAAARHQLGAGHHFTWHNGLYNTYYEPELDGLSRADRLAFLATLPNMGGVKTPDSTPDDAPRMAAHKGVHHSHKAAEAPHEVVAEQEPAEPKTTPEPTLTVVPMAATAPTLVPLAHTPDQLPAPESTPQPVHHDDFAANHNGTIDGTPIESVDMHEQVAHDANHYTDGDPLADAHHFGH